MSAPEELPITEEQRIEEQRLAAIAALMKQCVVQNESESEDNLSVSSYEQGSGDESDAASDYSFGSC